MMKNVALLGAAVLIAAAAGCVEETTAPTEAPQLDVSGSGRVAFYNAGVDRAVPASPCMDNLKHREFDFWVGGWQMGPQRSLVRVLLDGCVVEENYMPPTPPPPGSPPGTPFGPNAVQGRSINAYDPDTGRWHQSWVTIFPNGYLRMSGNLVDGVMKLSMPVFGPGGPSTITFDWTNFAGDSVRQAWNVFGNANSLMYRPLAGVTLAPAAHGVLCTEAGRPGVPNRQLDFLLGEWSVAAEHGPELGTATFTSDLSGCVTREEYSTPKGYAAISLLYYDANTRRFHRTYVDSEAERAEMSGTFVNGELVLRGAEVAPASTVAQTRNTFRRIDDNTFQQIWETSEDAIEWRVDLVLTFKRRYTAGSISWLPAPRW